MQFFFTLSYSIVYFLAFKASYRVGLKKSLCFSVSADFGITISVKDICSPQYDVPRNQHIKYRPLPAAQRTACSAECDNSALRLKTGLYQGSSYCMCVCVCVCVCVCDSILQ